MNRPTTGQGAPSVIYSPVRVNKVKDFVTKARKALILILENATVFFRVTILTLCLLYMFLLAISFCTELGTTLYSIAQKDLYVPTVAEVVKAEVVVNELSGRPNGIITDWLLNPEHAVIVSRALWTVIAVIPLLLAYAFGSYTMGKFSLVFMRFWEPTAGKATKVKKVRKAPIIMVNDVINPEWETVAREEKMR